MLYDFDNDDNIVVIDDEMEKKDIGATFLLL